MRSFLGITLISAFALIIPGVGPIPSRFGEVIGREVGSLPSNSSTIQVTRFRVATFNIHRGVGTDGKKDLARTAAELMGADLIGLNEVGASLQNGDQATVIGRTLDLISIFGPTERTWGHATFGNGLLSRFPILRWKSSSMRRSSKWRNSGFITADVSIGEQVVHIIVAHPEPKAMHSVQLREMVKLFSEAPTPALLIGDMNANGDHPELRDLRNAPDVVETHQVIEPQKTDRRIDHIYAKGFRILASGTKPTNASDHPVLWADLELIPVGENP